MMKAPPNPAAPPPPMPPPMYADAAKAKKPKAKSMTPTFLGSEAEGGMGGQQFGMKTLLGQ